MAQNEISESQDRISDEFVPFSYGQIVRNPSLLFPQAMGGVELKNRTVREGLVASRSRKMKTLM